MFAALNKCHRIGDIKPENVLLVRESNVMIKLIDFGSGCFDGNQKYEYIKSRFYRVTEGIIGLPDRPPMEIFGVQNCKT
jgi:dual specificity tyrosine-phosphorylation-regulated kinase 2/3/4